jgi:uncharacterized membrane protein
MKKHIFPLILIGATILVWLVAFPNLPEQVPTHWNFNGEINGYSTKLSAMLLQIAIMVLLYFSALFMPNIDPRKANYQYFIKGYKTIYNSLLAIFFVLNILMIMNGLDHDIPMSAVGTLVIGVIFIILGNFLPQIRSNFFIGVRTPWTLSNDEIWRKTHRFMGKIFFAAGIILILATFFSGTWKQIMVIGIIVVVIIAPYVFSFLEYKKLHPKKHE